MERLAERYQQAVGPAAQQSLNDSQSLTGEPLCKTPDTNPTIPRAMPASRRASRVAIVERFAEQCQQAVGQDAGHASKDLLSDTSKPVGKPTRTHPTIGRTIPAFAPAPWQSSNDSPSHASKQLSKTPDTNPTIQRAMPASCRASREAVVE
jgi:type II secretory pathway pseudopilin PulG